MAQVPYPHIESPGRVVIDGSLAFNEGDPIPLPTAKRYGLKGETFDGIGGGDGDFADVAIVTTADGDTTTYEAKSDDGPAAARKTAATAGKVA